MEGEARIGTQPFRVDTAVAASIQVLHDTAQQVPLRHLLGVVLGNATRYGRVGGWPNSKTDMAMPVASGRVPSGRT
jgi:hypothetical protein